MIDVTSFQYSGLSVNRSQIIMIAEQRDDFLPTTAFSLLLVNRSRYGSSRGNGDHPCSKTSGVGEEGRASQALILPRRDLSSS